MKLRFALLASTVFPLLMAPASALERSPLPLVIAQAEQPCPEGQDCPPAADDTSAEPAPQKPKRNRKPAAAGEQVQDGAAPVVTEEPQRRKPRRNQKPAADQQQPQGEPAPVVTEEPGPRKPRRNQQPAADQQQPQGEPAPVVTEEPAPRKPRRNQKPAAEPAPDQVMPEPAADDTVEQQLEEQGDDAEARSVRTLRQRLQQQLQDSVDIAPDDGGAASPNAGGANPGIQDDDNTNRPRRTRDRGWWDQGQGRDVIDRRGGRIIIDLGGGNLSVQPVAPDEGGRLLYGADDVEVQNLPRGMTRTIVHRRNGVDIVTVRDRYGDIVKRSKIFPDGTEIVLIDNRFPDDYQGERPQRLRNLPALVIGIPDDRYIVDYGGASDDDIRSALIAPPVQQLERPYRLDEVLQNEEVRAYSPRIDLDSITFETGSATIGNDQMQSLFQLGQAMEQIIAESPDELYLIEGHTDAVGRAGDNLILSDQRAEAVATALSQNFDIPPENLVTQGYGEEYLKVATDGPERRNRRAAVRRLTELLQAQNQ